MSFGPWTLDAARRQLLRGGIQVPLSPKAFDLLSVLAEHHDRAFSKADLHQHLWPDSFVSDGSLTILIAEIRQTLGDDAQRPTYVRTLPWPSKAGSSQLIRWLARDYIAITILT